MTIQAFKGLRILGSNLIIFDTAYIFVVAFTRHCTFISKYRRNFCVKLCWYPIWHGFCGGFGWFLWTEVYVYNAGLNNASRIILLIRSIILSPFGLFSNWPNTLHRNNTDIIALYVSYNILKTIITDSAPTLASNVPTTITQMVLNIAHSARVIVSCVNGSILQWNIKSWA